MRRFKTNKGILVEEYDSAPMNPRNDENLGTFYTFMSNRHSPDSHNNFRTFSEWIDSILSPTKATIVGTMFRNEGAEKGMAALMEYGKDAGYILFPVWHYTHSGTVYACSITNPFSCQFDSGLAGVIFVTKERLYREYGKRISTKIVAEVKRIFDAEVRLYGCYAEGEVYEYYFEGEEDGIAGCYGDIEESGVLVELGITEYEEIQ